MGPERIEWERNGVQRTGWAGIDRRDRLERAGLKRNRMEWNGSRGEARIGMEGWGNERTAKQWTGRIGTVG
jgi:hypothetical protein